MEEIFSFSNFINAIADIFRQVVEAKGKFIPAMAEWDEAPCFIGQVPVEPSGETEWTPPKHRAKLPKAA
ncbi:MAG: hypothetical protein FWG10_12140 [Eubacteriaceae bacterium]|nr:hypothetical protein [Eubacteriaceae bacterium]